jgi:hypothetical protein
MDDLPKGDQMERFVNELHMSADWAKRQSLVHGLFEKEEEVMVAERNAERTAQQKSKETSK